MELTNHKVLVTGGSAGIGLAIARKFVDLGNKVAICGRDKAKLDKAKAELGAIETIQCDLADHDAPALLAARVAEKLGGLSVLVNNAGMQENYSFLNTAPDKLAEDVHREIQVNLTSVINLTAACLPLLHSTGHSAVINVSSGLAITPKASAPVYCATKAAIHSFSQALRYQCEDGAPNISVFEILPPLVDTAMTHGRGSNKISTRQMVDEMFKGLERDRHEVNVSKVKLLRIIHRLAPSIAARILRDS